MCLPRLSATQFETFIGIIKDESDLFVRLPASSVTYKTETHLMDHEQNQYKVQLHGRQKGVTHVEIGSSFVYVGKTGYMVELLYRDNLYDIGPCEPNTILTVKAITDYNSRRVQYRLSNGDGSWQSWVEASLLTRLINNDQLRPLPPELHRTVFGGKPSTFPDTPMDTPTPRPMPTPTPTPTTYIHTYIVRDN